MTELPKTLDEAISQAKKATEAAIADGGSRLQVELLFPELKPMPVAEQFITLFSDLGSQLRVFFADAGAAALAKRDWGQTWEEMPFDIRGVKEIQAAIQPEDQAFVVVAPTSGEVDQIQKMAEQAGDRPFILLNPQLQDVAIVGIGYAGRQLRERFLSTFDICYSLRPLENGTVFRAYPAGWQVWRQLEGEYQLIAEEPRKPSGEDLERIFAQVSSPSETKQDASRTKPGLLTNLQRFLRALSQ